MDVIRSRHYTWLGNGLGGDPIDDAMVTITADVMHICIREGIDIDSLIAKSKARFEQEERALREHADCPPIETTATDSSSPTTV
jgi:hypothetical protein